VHDVEEGFEDLGRGINGDGFVRDAFGLEEVSEVGAGGKLGTCYRSIEVQRGRGCDQRGDWEAGEKRTYL
jgi:hypothetical protein